MINTHQYAMLIKFTAKTTRSGAKTFAEEVGGIISLGKVGISNFININIGSKTTNIITQIRLEAGSLNIPMLLQLLTVIKVATLRDFLPFLQKLGLTKSKDGKACSSRTGRVLGTDSAKNIRIIICSRCIGKMEILKSY